MQNIVWFRSDLRSLDNPALTAAQALGNIRAVFCITLKQWQEHDWGANKIGFILQCVLDLQIQLHKLNINLDLIDCDDFKTQPIALAQYLQTQNATTLLYNCEYELNEIRRDVAVTDALNNSTIKIQSFHSQTLIAPGKILTKQNTPYTVFTPFKKSCYEYLFKHALIIEPKPKHQTTKIAPIKSNIINSKYSSYINNPILKIWPAGQNAALKILNDFCSSKIEDYKSHRDFPALSGTSTLSPYLAAGCISAKQCFIAALNTNNNELAGGNPNITCWMDELLWRDFYKQIMYHFPKLGKGENFNAKYDKLNWRSPGKSLEAWKNGKTGIPLIDAAMRQLVSTGWMHNRLRMVVAMFLTKNLLIDWRHGEKFFSEHLVDLDFASNNGGWQWSASTGTDAVPYFRIFNPISQSLKFDAHGTFIKQYCPELAALNAKQIHNPSSNLSPTELAKLNYPRIIVDVAKSRLRALEYFKS